MAKGTGEDGLEMGPIAYTNPVGLETMSFVTFLVAGIGMSSYLGPAIDDAPQESRS